MTDPAPRYSVQLLLSLVAAALLSVGAFAVAAAAVDTAAICAEDDHSGPGGGGDHSGPGGD
jgi:hypothetical protein